jgi:hypothetical protein
MSPFVCIVGGGPAGLMAAECLLKQGFHVELFDAMPSLGRKFLMAGKSGLNLTHAEPLVKFLGRYGDRQTILAPLINAFGPNELRQWADELGVETFVGSSQRVFPSAMKAAPLLRAWLHRLRSDGLIIHVRHYWKGWDDRGSLIFDTPQGEYKTKPTATLLALGGASWPQLGSTGAWQTILAAQQIAIKPLESANCGLNVPWSAYLRTHHAGDAVKTVSISMQDVHGLALKQQGDFVISEYGIEGSLIYAFASAVREWLNKTGAATLYLDLNPNRTYEQLVQALSQARGSNTFAKHLQRQAGIKDVKAKLLREFTPEHVYGNPVKLARQIKSLPITITQTRPIEEAISSAGGVIFEELDQNLMLQKTPGVFCAGEMLDWEAPTGGYLFTACFATGYAAARGIINWLDIRKQNDGSAYQTLSR